MGLRSWPLLIILLFYTGLLNSSAEAQDSDSLQSFYTVTEFFSDFLPDGYTEILDVTPQGGNVRVRIFRISLATPYCDWQLVRAVERILPDTDLRKVTQNINACSYSEKHVAGALAAAAPKTSQTIEDSATLRIVAKCGSNEKVFDFPYAEEVDLKSLHRHNPEVDALWGLSYNVRSRAFGQHFSLREPPSAQEKEYEDLGTRLLPELLSGRFDNGFSGYECGNQPCSNGYLGWRLKGYTKPPENRTPGTVELINLPSLKLAKYDLPGYPRLALMARISGEVRLKITADQQTGMVREVRTISGNMLLADAAIAAVRKWQFAVPARQEPVEAVLNFDLRCGGE